MHYARVLESRVRSEHEQIKTYHFFDDGGLFNTFYCEKIEDGDES